MSRPFFSVVITTYNRLSSVQRCIESCLLQTFSDFEVVVVDDGSTDGTLEALEARWGSRVRVITHDSNRGINPSRYTGVCHSRGEWIVVVDSDWELLPTTLRRLHEVIQRLPDGVRVIRTQLLWDDGHVSPAFGPPGLIGYEDRIRWIEELGRDTDAGRCLHRTVFEKRPYFRERRGAMEMLYELRLAKNETSVFVADVLGKEHTDAPNSYVRGVSRRDVVPRLLREAPDMLWMAETTLREHGGMLARYGPTQYRESVRTVALNAFLSGDRKKGLRYGLVLFRSKKSDLIPWITMILGLVGPQALAHGVLVYRRLRGHV